MMRSLSLLLLPLLTLAPAHAEPDFIGAPPAATPAKDSPLTPEEEQKTFTLAPGFEIELVAAESEGIGKFVTVDWDQRGRLWTMTALEYPVDGNENAERARALYESPGKDKVLVIDDAAGPGPHQPRVFADGLAIPLGILPQNEGVYVQHGSKIELLQDTDGDGRADQRTPLLTGFGVQDSHLLMHQFTRMPGGWIWAAQGAFNSGKVKTTQGVETDFPNTRMARFRPDGSQFDILCNGPCNIWGFAQNSEGELFIQEANDYGYPCMPFQIGANYPGCADRLFKSYAPEFPGTAQDFRMGGTGLSGLALSDAQGSFAGPYADTMYVANPIIRKIQALRLHREGPRWAIAKLPDFIESSDPMFRPVSIQFGPDGALYIVDWYNKIISHNEVPRNHPDRDKIRGRIWRVKQTGQKLAPLPDLTKCSEEQLLTELRGPSVRRGNLAWQAIVDRKLKGLGEKLLDLATGKDQPPSTRLRALWAMEGLNLAPPVVLHEFLTSENRNLRVQGAQVLARTEPDPAAVLHFLSPLAKDSDPEVRAEVIRALSGLYAAGSNENAIGVGKTVLGKDDAGKRETLSLLTALALPSLDGPVEPSTKNKKPVKVREAYEREFERYLIREALEQNASLVFAFLTSAKTDDLPFEGRLLATLALSGRESAAGLAKLLPQLQRSPNDEEILRLAMFPAEPGVAEALRSLLQNEKSRLGVLEALLRVQNRLDAQKLKPLLTPIAIRLVNGDDTSTALGFRLATAFSLADSEDAIYSRLERMVLEHGWVISPKQSPTDPSKSTPAITMPGYVVTRPEQASLIIAALDALAETGCTKTRIYTGIYRAAKLSPVQDAALNALSRSRAEDAPSTLFGLWGDLSPSQRHAALGRLSSTPSGAHAVTAAFEKKIVRADDFDGPTIDRLQTVLHGDEALKPLIDSLGSLFRPVLRVSGGANTFAEPEKPITLAGPFTVETWVRLAPGISNEDGLLGVPGKLDMNFFGERFRVWAGPEVKDAIVAKKKMVPDNWTHLAITRDGNGQFKIYVDGELDQDQGNAAPQPFEKVRVAWTQQKKGTDGMFCEYRIWSRARTAEEIRNNFDRALDPAQHPADLIYHAPGAGPWGHLHGQAAIARTSDYPPLFTPAEATALDAKFAKYRALAGKPGGDLGRGKNIAALCMACHLIQGQGGNIAPNISGAGTMGLEALLRNIITPNAAMEAGYRIFRVELKSGELIDGFFVSEDKDAVIVRLPGAPDRRLPRADLRQSQYLRRSLMPEGILDGLTPEQVTDLFAYLMSLKG